MLLAEIIRISLNGATERDVSEELSLTPMVVGPYLRLLSTREMLVHVEGRYFPSKSGLDYLRTVDAAADLSDVDDPQDPQEGFRWDRSELAERMREIIDR